MMSLAIPRALAQDVRSDNLFSKRDTAVPDAPATERASSSGGGFAGARRGAAADGMAQRRDAAYAGEFTVDADDSEAYGDGIDGEFARQRRRGEVRQRFRGGLLPRTLWGRIAAGCGLLALAGGGVAGALAVHGFLLRDEHFTVADSESIQIAGNSRLTRAQLLSVFGEDVDRNVFTVPLAQRRAELESLPWVAHATVMRLLPNRVRVAIVERTPVAFVREGAQIGLVDANGVLLDMPRPEDAGAGDGAEARSVPRYSFPVLTGIAAADPLSMRVARMRIYIGFLSALDAGGEKISQRVSEVDLSDPEDVKAVLSDAGSGGADLLVHFGDEKFLERYQRYREHLVEWRAQYPRLASVDLRYERQVVLQMQPGAAAAAADAGGPAEGNAEAAKDSGAVAAAKPAASSSVKTAATAKAGTTAKAEATATAGVGVQAALAARAAASARPAAALTTSFPVSPLGAKLGGKGAASGATPQETPQ